MTMNRRAVLFAIAALLLAPAAARGATPDARLVTFAVGGAPAELDVWEAIVGEFTGRTGIPVELLRQPTDTGLRRQALVVALSARVADPDVFLMDVAWLAQFAASGWLAPLDAGTGGQACAPDNVFFPRVLDLVDRHRGRLVALPVYIDGGLLYYRKDLLERFGFTGPPDTWEDLLRASLRIQREMRKDRPGFWGFAWQGAQYEGLVCNFLEFAGADGGIALDEDGNLLVDTQANREALRFMRDLIHLQAVSPPSTYTGMREEEARLLFQGGNALFERNWPYALALHRAPGSPVREVTGIAALPAFGPGRAASTLGGWHVGISAFSDAPEESRKLVCFLTSYAIQKALALRLGWNPGRRDVYEDPTVLVRMPHFGTLRRVFETLRPRPVLPYYAQVSKILQRRLNAALAGRDSPAEALAAAQREIRRAVSRYRTGR
jgi:multiple sugar transport system substrate-binding protein